MQHIKSEQYFQVGFTNAAHKAPRIAISASEAKEKELLSQ
jgi:hypothetical protein